MFVKVVLLAIAGFAASMTVIAATGPNADYAVPATIDGTR